MALFTADWTPLEKNVYYRKIELYSMEWSDQINLSEFIIAASQFGGPIGLCTKKSPKCPEKVLKLTFKNLVDTLYMKQPPGFYDIGNRDYVCKLLKAIYGLHQSGREWFQEFDTVLTAITRDDKKLHKVFENAKPNINIFSSSGQSISSILWQSGKLVHLAWSSTEDLLCITEDGTIHSYDIHGKFQDATKMGPDVKNTKVLECKVFNSRRNYTGIAVLTGAYHIYMINNIKEPRIRKMAHVPGLSTPPSSWAVITEEHATKILLAKDAQLYILDQSKDKCLSVVVDFQNPINAVIEISVSFNHQHVALFSDSGPIWLGSSNLEEKYSEFDTESKTRPQQLVWCGNGAVVGFWQNIMLVVGLDKCYLNYHYKTPIHMVPEIDGVRIISNESHELLQKVPESMVDVFRIGSVSSSALLLAASKEFQHKNHKADEYLRMIRERNEMELAVENCIQAAGHEFQPSTQRMLLRAANFGKSFIPNEYAEPFVTMCQTLKILNTVRLNTIGLPLTYKQLEFLTLRVLLDRLVLRRHYPLAIAICKYMRIPDTEGKSRILSRWACYKVKCTNIDPDHTARVIAGKLGYTPGISYSEIANKAMDFGQKHLSVKLLDYETRASEQVPLLIKLKHEDQAMNKAIESGDTDLVFTVILHLKNTMKKGDFHMTIRKFPVAFSLYIMFCKDQDFKLLRDIYDQESDFNSEAECRVLESYRTHRLELCITSLQAAVDAYRKGKNDFTAQLTDEQVKLLRYQIKLEEKLQGSYLDLSLHGTMKKILAQREYDWADVLRKEFKFPDRRFWWLKILILAEGGEWLELEKFSKSKKSPIGYEPFVDVCIKFGSQLEAKRYIPKVKDENKVKNYIKVGMLDEAAKVAFEQKDINALDNIQSFITVMDRALNERIMTMKSQLGSKR